MEEQVIDLVWLASLVGLLLPTVISFVKRNEWSRKTKQVVAFVVSAVAGLVTVAAESGWSLADPVEFIQLAIFGITDIWVVASVTYNHFFDSTMPEIKLSNIGSRETKTKAAA